MLLSIIDGLKEGNDFCQLLVSSKKVDRAFEVILPYFGGVCFSGFLVIFEAMAWLDSRLLDLNTDPSLNFFLFSLDFSYI